MSQFCGSFWALSRRSRLTVSLYCACGCEVESVASETPARMVQDKRTRARVLWGMRFFSLEGRLLSGRSMALTAVDNSICEHPARQWEVAPQPVSLVTALLLVVLRYLFDTYLPAAF